MAGRLLMQTGCEKNAAMITSHDAAGCRADMACACTACGVQEVEGGG